MTKKAHTIRIPSTLNDQFMSLPINRSAAIAQSIANAGREPDIVARAFRLRLNQSPGEQENDVKTTYTRDAKLDQVIDRLIELTKLSGEQVVRLCMEAYIHRL